MTFEEGTWAAWLYNLLKPHVAKLVVCNPRKNALLRRILSGTQGSTIVSAQFDMHANPTTGLIQGSLYGYNQIFCGNVNSTQWLVTPYKASGQIAGQGQYNSLSAPGTFDPSVNMPTTVPPLAPGIWSTKRSTITAE